MGRRKTPNASEQQEILRRQKGLCFYCESPFGGLVRRKGQLEVLRLEWDHLVPYSYLQANPIANFVGACHVCNRAKGDHIFRTLEGAIQYILDARFRRGYEMVGSGEAQDTLGLVECAWRECTNRFEPSVRGGPKKAKRFCSRKCYWRNWNESHPRVTTEIDDRDNDNNDDNNDDNNKGELNDGSKDGD